MDHDEEVVPAVPGEEFTAALDRGHEADPKRSAEVDLTRWVRGAARAPRRGSR
nr:hypothetical protein [Streptomyces hygroscopicus]